MNEQILVVDDEAAIADLVEVYLKNEGYTVYKAGTAAQAMELIQRQKLDLAILDVMLPDLDGFSLCRKIRERHLFPILMLTAKVEDMDKITGLALGADDYLTKPFNPLELVARVKTQLRRYLRYDAASTGEPDRLDIRALSISKEGHKCTLNGKETPLGTYKFYAKYRWKYMHDDPNGRGIYCQFLNRFYNGYLVHSLIYKDKADSYHFDPDSYNNLGAQSSDGCIRLKASEAQWVYENCPNGTQITMFEV